MLEQNSYNNGFLLQSKACLIRRTIMEFNSEKFNRTNEM